MNKVCKNAAILLIAVVLIFGAKTISAQISNDTDNASVVSGDVAPVESNENTDAIQKIINEDENITAEDLEIKEPTLLPGNPFYFVKNIGRSIKSATTFNPVKKAELKLRFANERLMEIQKIAKSNDNPGIMEKALDKYKKEVEGINQIAEKIKEKGGEKTEEFVNKFIDNQIKHQKLFGKIEREAPQEIFEKIQENRQTAIQTLSDVSLTLINADRFQEKMEERMESQNGSDFKNFKNLEILRELENKVPDTAKDAIRRAQENTLKRLSKTIRENENIAENLTLYTKNIGGDAEKHLEIINEIEMNNELDEQNIPEEVKHALEKAREINIERIKNKIERVETNEQTEEKIKDTHDSSDDKIEKTTIFQESSKEQIEKAALMIEKAKNNFESAKNNNTVNDKLNSALILIKNAQIHLEKARTAYEKKIFNEAFGYSNSAISNASNALRIITQLEINKIQYENKETDNTKNINEDIKNESDRNHSTINNDPTTAIEKNQKICAQIITPAKNQKTGECREFPTACLPVGWYGTRACEKNQINPTDKDSDVERDNTSAE